MKRTKIMALLLAFCLAVPSPMATLAADTSTTPTIEGTTGDSQNPENGGASQNKENGETKDADQDGKQNENSKNADGKSAEGNSGNSNSVNGDSQNDKNGSGDSESKDSENKDSANGNSGENSNSQTGENLAKSGNSESNSVKIGETSYNSISEAISAASNGAIIIAIGSFRENITIPKEKSITLNLGGTLEASDSNSVAITNNGTLLINSGVIKSSANTIKNLGNLTLTGCSVSTTSNIESCIESGNQGTTTYQLTIHGGKIEGGKYVIENNSGTVTIEGAEVVGGQSSSSLIYNSGSLVITSGTFTKKNTSGSLITKVPDANPEATIQISGGTFSDSINEDWLAEGKGLREKTTESTTVYEVYDLPVVAYIKDKNYASLQAAVNAANNNDTITMAANVSISNPILVYAKTITLELNGKQITYSADNTVANETTDAFVVCGQASLTVRDSEAKEIAESGKSAMYGDGKIENRTDTDACAIAVYGGSSLTLQSGMISGKTYGIYAAEEGTSVTIENGYVCSGSNAVEVYDGAAVTVKGGILKAPQVIGNNEIGVSVEGYSRAPKDTTIKVKAGNLICEGSEISVSINGGIVSPGSGTIEVSGGTISAKNGLGILMEDGVLTMTGGYIQTEGCLSPGGDQTLPVYGIYLQDGGNYVDENQKTKFGSNVGDDETNTFYAEISGGKIVAPEGVDAIKTAVSDNKNCSEKTIGGIVVKKASSGFAPAFSSAVNANYCYIEKDAELDKTITQLAPTDNRKGQAGVDDDAPYSVDNRVWMRFVGDRGTTDISGAAGNKVDSDTENKKIANELKATIPQKDASSSDKVNVFLGWYEAEAKQDGKEGYEKKNGAVRVNLDDILTVIPAEDITYLPVFMEVDKGTATGEAELQGTALPKDTTTAGKTVLETMSKAVKSAAEKLAKAVEKAEADTVLVSITVDANKKTRDEVSTDADKIQATLASNETIQGYYDVSLTQTTYKASYTDASADVTVAAENGAGTELKPTQTTVSAALHELDTKIPVTLDMDPEYLQNRQLRVVEVHDGEVLDLEYTFDSENNLMTVQMDKFSTVAVVSATYTTVTFDSMGGSDVGKENVSYGNKVTKPADPTRSGYKFLGWYTEKAYKNAYGFDVSVTDMTPFTLYAKWEAVSTDNQDKDKDKNNSNNNNNSNSDNKSNSGSSSGSSKSSSSSSSVSSANTGDQAAPALWLFVLVLAGAGAAGTGYYFRKKRQ